MNDGCIEELKVSATTGKLRGAGFSTYSKSHRIVLQLKNGQLQANIKGPAYYDSPYTLDMNFARDFHTEGRCIKRSDITQVSLVAAGDDNWYITEVTTYIRIGTGPYEELTSDPVFNKWLDKNSADTTKLVLSLGIEDTPLCGYGTPICECKAEADVCIFNLEIDEIRTFTSYQKFPVGEGEGLFVRGTQGVVYSIKGDGTQKPLKQYEGRHCAKNFNPVDCSDPQFVDGKTYRMAIGVNGHIPGPTIIVHDKQKIVIHVHNNMTSEGISIHWHGMHQIGTPWMDGVGQVTQCQIGPSSSFSYIYMASPSGTFWYHSHSGAQGTDGFFGALIVKERPDRLQEIKAKLRVYDVSDFEDLPNKHIASHSWIGSMSHHLIYSLNLTLVLDFILEYPLERFLVMRVSDTDQQVALIMVMWAQCHIFLGLSMAKEDTVIFPMPKQDLAFLQLSKAKKIQISPNRSTGSVCLQILNRRAQTHSSKHRWILD